MPRRERHNCRCSPNYRMHLQIPQIRCENVIFYISPRDGRDWKIIPQKTHAQPYFSRLRIFYASFLKFVRGNSDFMLYGCPLEFPE